MIRSQANQRVEEFKSQLKSLKSRLNEAEKRALFAEKSVKSYLAELDLREGMRLIYVQRIIFAIIYNRMWLCVYVSISWVSERLRKEKEKIKYIVADLDSTFAELTSY